jgi:hypothetical protein
MGIGLTSALSLFHLSTPFFIFLSIYTLSSLMLIHNCIKVMEVFLSCNSVGLYALLYRCMPMENLGIVGVGEVGCDTVG